MSEHSQDRHDPGGGGDARRLAFWAFMLLGAYFLITEHRAHVVQFLPFLLLLACPLLHMFHGHGGHEEHQEGATKPSEQSGGKDQTPAPHAGH